MIRKFGVLIVFLCLALPSASRSEDNNQSRLVYWSYALAGIKLWPGITPIYDRQVEQYRRYVSETVSARTRVALHNILDNVARDVRSSPWGIRGVFGPNGRQYCESKIRSARLSLQHYDILGAKKQMLEAAEIARQVGVDL